MRQVRECDFCGEGASGVFEPLPASVDPDGPRLLLCEGCRGRLADVVDPLLERVDGAGTLDPDDTSGSAAGGPAGDGTDDTTGSAPGQPTGGTSDATAGTPGGTATTEAGDSAGGGTGATGGHGGAASAGGGVDAGGRSGEEREGTPRGYRKVMRFLENRSLPMERDEAEHLAAEAYDLDEGTAGAAIDHAVKYGRLREVRGELRR